MRAQPVTVVMYHYIRPRDSRFPKMHGLTPEEFEAQLIRLQRNYAITNISDLFEEKTEKPRLVLSFDDGLSDHVEYVLPLLQKHGVRGIFFPVLPDSDATLLPFHRIHLILATGAPIVAILKTARALYEEATKRWPLATWDEQETRFRHAFGYDDAETIFLKRLVQRMQPRAAAESISQELYDTFVPIAEASMAKQYYPPASQWQLLAEEGHSLGAHTRSHPWLADLSAADQLAEIQGSVAPILSPGWSFAFPYGAYNDTTLNLLRNLGCRFAFSTQPGVCELLEAGFQVLPRLDTKEFSPPIPPEKGLAHPPRLL